MNKTVTINISGIIFHIEEDAFESLSKYLSTIKGYFSSTEGGLEIMSDIEARIAELLQAKINPAKQVIVMADVEYVMSVMGKPEEFAGDTTSSKSTENEQSAYREEKIRRRLFRNPDDKAIGGVCSGLAAYFDIDTVWIRLAMFALVFFGGLSIWVYIILWIVMPEAKTTADKFAMRGESANINNIFRSFKEEAEDVKNRMNKYGSDFRAQNYGEQVRENVSTVLRTIFNVIGRLFGLFLIFLGGVLLLAYLGSLMGMSILDGNTDIGNWRHAIFSSTGDYVMGVTAFIIVLGIPVFMLIYAGVKMLFKIRYSNRWLNLGLGLVWLIGVILGLVITVKTVNQFDESARLKETFQLHGVGDTIVIKLNPGMMNIKPYDFDNEDDIDNFLNNNHGGFYFAEKDHRLTVLGYADLNVQESSGDSVELIINRIARGADKKEANENAKAINYQYHQEGNKLIFDELYLVSEGKQFRNPSVDIRLRIPKGTVVYFDKSTKYLLEDVENTTNTWDGDMVGRRWVMTGRGLQCLDCDGLDDNEWIDEQHPGRRHKHKEKVTINDEGIHVEGEDAHVKIDENGIKINTPDEDVEINGDGVKTRRKDK